jgi:hypothetical protein
VLAEFTRGDQIYEHDVQIHLDTAASVVYQVLPTRRRTQTKVFAGTGKLSLCVELRQQSLPTIHSTPPEFLLKEAVVRGLLSTGLRGFAVSLCGLALLLSSTAHAQTPSIEGTYRLVSRQLPDGTTKTAPDVFGLLTFTKTHRTLNVVWNGPNDLLFSYSLASSYKLAPGKYTEKVLFSSLNDHIAGQGTAYDLVGKTQTVQVVTGKAIASEKPRFDLPTMIIDGNTITTTAEGTFIDTWEKVEQTSGAQAQASNPE